MTREPPTVDAITAALAHARDGDPDAFERFVVLTRDSVRRFCRYLGDANDVDDLAQTTYLRALRSLHTYRGDSAGQVWLLGIARRVCADAVAARVRHRRPDPRLRPGHHPDHAPVVELEGLVAMLEVDLRRAFVLTQVLGLSYDHAAAVCACPIGTIRSRVARARRLLDESLRSVDRAV